MIPCDGRIETKWWMYVLCFFGIHWHGRTDAGIMGDAYQCHVCGKDDYIPCVIIHKECRDEFWMLYTEGPLGEQQLIGRYNLDLLTSKRKAKLLVEDMDRQGLIPEGHDVILSDGKNSYLLEDEWSLI